MRDAAAQMEEATDVLREMERRLFTTAGLDFSPPNGGIVGEEAEGAIEDIKRRVREVEAALRYF